MASPIDDSQRLRAAIRLVLQRYARQVKASPWLAALSLILPGLGNIFVFYVPPLAIANLLGTLAEDPHASTGELIGPVVVLAGAWLGGEALWRIAGLVISKFEVRGIGALHREAIADLHHKDAAFF